MIFARYLLTAENMATPRLKLDDQNRVFPPSEQKLSYLFTMFFPASSVLPETNFTSALKAFI